MTVIKPFRCVRPAPQAVSQVAALPYDVYSRKEAREEVEGKPLSFLNIDRPETQFPDDWDMYDESVYQKARELLQARISDGTFVTGIVEAYYIYELTMEGRSQTGIAACASVDDYVNNVIKKHENTREDKELDRIRHVDITNAHTGPIFLAYRSSPEINKITGLVTGGKALYDFTSEDHIRHRVWKIDSADMVKKIEEAFARVPSAYIADGHHRAASAIKVALKRRKENPGYTGKEPFNYFLSVLFPDDQLMIMPYNRVVKDLNGLSKDQFLKEVDDWFEIRKAGKMGESPFAPKEKGVFGMLLDGVWYRLTLKESTAAALKGDPVKSLDVSILQDYLLRPILGIGDERTDKRIAFIGGIRGLSELERRVGDDMKIAFSLYPTSIEELFAVADAGLLMPPKSTWFEPKLRSGLFIHMMG
ncbi:DUF1015 domain-containing protein [Lachnospiraceae bacterium 62-35]